jgi:hypothetical protein
MFSPTHPFLHCLREVTTSPNADFRLPSFPFQTSLLKSLKAAMIRARARNFALTSCPISSLPDHNNSLRLSRPARSLHKPPLFVATFQFPPPTQTRDSSDFSTLSKIHFHKLTHLSHLYHFTAPTHTLLLSPTVVSSTHKPRALIITCTHHPTGLAHSLPRSIKGTTVTMASNNTPTTPSQHGSHTPSDRESTSHVQGSTSSRPTSFPTTPASEVAPSIKRMSIEEWTASRKQAAAARKLATLESEKNENGKRPLDEEEKVVDDATLPQKKHESAAAREQVASPEKTTKKVEDAQATSQASAPITTSATITAPATISASASTIKHVASTEPAAKKSKDAPAASKASTNTTATATTTTTATASSKAPASTQATAPRMASASTSKASASRMASATNTSKASGSRMGPPATTTRASVPSKASASTTTRAPTPSKPSASATPSAARNTSSVARKTPTARKDSPAATLPATKKAPATRETPAAKKAPVARETSSAASKPAGVKKTLAATTTPPPASKVLDTLIKAQAAAKAEALKAEAEAAQKSASAAAKKAAAASKARAAPQAPDPKQRFQLTAKGEHIRPAVRSEAAIVKERDAARKRSLAATELGRNHKVNPKLLEITAAQEEAKKASKTPRTKGAPVGSRFRLTGKDIFATKKAKGPAEKASNKTQADHNAAVKASNDVASASKQVAKALADKSNTTPPSRGAVPRLVLMILRSRRSVVVVPRKSPRRRRRPRSVPRGPRRL